MRIITGSFKGRKILVPRGLQVRPTTDFARTGLFNILENHLEWAETDALDLFSGSGSISIELISRGARHVTSVDQSNTAIQFIHKICENLDISNLTPIRGDALAFAKSTRARYGLIFCDPPYEWEHARELLTVIHSRELLVPGGWLVYEHSARENYSDIQGFFDHRKYGKVNFSFFKSIQA